MTAPTEEGVPPPRRLEADTGELASLRAELEESRALARAVEAEEVAAGDDLVQQVRDLQGKALGILKSAEASGDLKTALGAIKEAGGCMELLAKLVYTLAKDHAAEPQTFVFQIGKGYIVDPPAKPLGALLEG